MIIRPMRPDDVAEVTALEALANPHPWSHRQLAEELTLSQSRVDVAIHQESGRIAGYLCCWRVVDELHIQNVATHPDFRRQGVARALLQAAAAQATEATVALLEVRAGSAGALALYTALGFVKTGLRKKYYRPNQEDAVLMQAPIERIG